MLQVWRHYRICRKAVLEATITHASINGAGVTNGVKAPLETVLGHEHIVERILGRSGHPRLSMYKCVSAKAFMP
jgi:hypothetical protein